jgi:hypothetical protein
MSRSVLVPALVLAGAALSLSCRSGGPPAQPAAAPVAAPEPSPPHYSNTVRWRTNQLSHAGYDVYRAEAESGPFVRINAVRISGAGKRNALTQEFEYVDAEIDASKDYWYYVEAIPLMGEPFRFTPIRRAPAKAAAPAATGKRSTPPQPSAR